MTFNLWPLTLKYVLNRGIIFFQLRIYLLLINLYTLTFNLYFNFFNFWPLTLKYFLIRGLNFCFFIPFLQLYMVLYIVSYMVCMYKTTVCMYNSYPCIIASQNNLPVSYNNFTRLLQVFLKFVAMRTYHLCLISLNPIKIYSFKFCKIYIDHEPSGWKIVLLLTVFW